MAASTIYARVDFSSIEIGECTSSEVRIIDGDELLHFMWTGEMSLSIFMAGLHGTMSQQMVTLQGTNGVEIALDTTDAGAANKQKAKL